MKQLFATAVIVLLMLPLIAQVELPRPDFNPFKSSGSSFLGVNNLSMSHSMGFSAGVSSGGYGYYLSRYTNQLKYSFNPKLDLELDLNFVNYGTTSSKFSLNKDNTSKFLPEFKLTYKPSDSVNFSIEFRQGNPWIYEQQMPWDNRW